MSALDEPELVPVAMHVDLMPAAIMAAWQLGYIRVRRAHDGWPATDRELRAWLYGTADTGPYEILGPRNQSAAPLRWEALPESDLKALALCCLHVIAAQDDKNRLV